MPTNIFDMADTWNAIGTTFNGIYMNFTDGAGGAPVGAAASRFLRLDSDGSSVFDVDSSGNIRNSGGLVTNFIQCAGNANISTTDDIGGLLIGAAGDVQLRRDNAADIGAFKRGTNANILRVYRTFTDFSNYERQAFQSGSGFFEWAAETAGTGTDNIDLRITPAGTGVIDVRNVQVSTTSSNTATLTNAIASAAPALWINVKATGGNYVMPLWATI